MGDNSLAAVVSIAALGLLSLAIRQAGLHIRDLSNRLLDLVGELRSRPCLIFRGGLGIADPAPGEKRPGG